MRRAAWGLAAVLSLVAALGIVRTVAGWHADAMRWRAASPVAMDTLAVQAALRARDSARAREAVALERLDAALRRWEETRGPVGARGSRPAATVAPPTVAAALEQCDELADACARFRDEAAARAVADSIAAETRRQADSASAHARIALAQRAAADSIAAARDRVRVAESRARRSQLAALAVVVGAVLLAR